MITFLECVQAGEVLVETPGRGVWGRENQAQPQAAASDLQGSTPEAKGISVTKVAATQSRIDAASMQSVAAFDTSGSGSIAGSQLCEALSAIGIYIAESDACHMLECASLQDIGVIPLEDVYRIAQRCIEGLAQPDLESMLTPVNFKQLIARKMEQSLRIKTLSQLAQCSSEVLRSALAGAEALIADEILRCTVVPSAAASSPEATAHEANAKFAAMAGAKEGTYGSMQDFMQGLDAMIGLPNPQVEHAMQLEHLHSDDSADDFVTSNYGGTRTCPASEWEFVVTPDLSKQYPGMQPPHGRFPKELATFLQHEAVARAGLSRAEVVALRLYTGPMYMKYNAVLRKFPQHMVSSLRGNTYATTIHALVSGIIKLSQHWKLPPNRKVYRGLGGLLLPSKFWQVDEYGCRGGVEFGVMSTTTDRMVAAQYSGQWGTNSRQTVMEIDVGQVDRGASLSWISQYPGEQEILLPPLSNLEVVGQARVEMTERGEMLVMPMKVSVNLKSKTVEQLVAQRQQLQVSMVHHLFLETKRELGGHHDMLARFQQLLQDESSKPAEWFNEDSNLIASMSAAVEMRTAILERHRVMKEAESKLLARRQAERRRELEAQKERLEREETELIAFVEGDAGKLVIDTLREYAVLVNHEHVGSEAMEYFVRWRRHSMAKTVEDVLATTRSQHATTERPRDPQCRHPGPAHQRWLAREAGMSPVAKMQTSVMKLAEVVDSGDPGIKFREAIVHVRQACPRLSLFVTEMILGAEDGGILEAGGWTAATERLRLKIEATLSEEANASESSGAQATPDQDGLVPPRMSETTRKGRDKYLREALSEIPLLGLSLWRSFYPLRLYVQMLQECAQAAEHAAASVTRGGPLDTEGLEEAFEQAGATAWKALERHQRLLAHISGVQQELAEVESWSDLSRRQEQALSDMDAQIRSLRAAIDADTGGLITWDEQLQAQLPPMSAAEEERPWLIPQHGGEHRTVLEWAVLESRDVADAMAERERVWNRCGPSAEDRRRRELTVLGSRLAAVAHACRGQLLLTARAESEDEPGAAGDGGGAEARDALEGLREFWRVQQRGVCCAHHRSVVLTGFASQDGKRRSAAALAEAYDVCEVCTQVLDEQAARFQCAEKDFHCRRMLCCCCHFVVSRCQTAFEADPRSQGDPAGDGPGINAREAREALALLVRLCRLVGRTYRRSVDWRFEAALDARACRRLQTLSEDVVSATTLGEGEGSGAVMQRVAALVEKTERSCLRHARLSLSSALRGDGSEDAGQTQAAQGQEGRERAQEEVLRALQGEAQRIREESRKLQLLVERKDYAKLRSLEEHRRALRRRSVEAVVVSRIGSAPLMHFCRPSFVRRVEGVVDVVARLGRELPWMDEGDEVRDSEAFGEWVQGRLSTLQGGEAREQAQALVAARGEVSRRFGAMAWRTREEDEALRGGWYWGTEALPEELQREVRALEQQATAFGRTLGQQLFGDRWRQRLLMPAADPLRFQTEVARAVRSATGERQRARRSMLRVLELAEVGLQEGRPVDLRAGRLWQGASAAGEDGEGRAPDSAALEEAFWLGGLCPMVEEVAGLNVEQLAGKSAEEAAVTLRALSPLELSFVCGLLHWTRADLTVIMDAPEAPQPPSQALGALERVADRTRRVLLSEMVAAGGRLDGRFQLGSIKFGLMKTLIEDDGGSSCYGDYQRGVTDEDELDVRLLAAMLRLPVGAGLRERSHAAAMHALQRGARANPFARRLDHLHLSLRAQVSAAAWGDLLRAAAWSVAELTLEMRDLKGDDEGLLAAMEGGLASMRGLRKLTLVHGLTDAGARAVAAAICAWGPLAGSGRMHPREGSEVRGFWLNLSRGHSFTAAGAKAMAESMLAMASGLGDGDEPEWYTCQPLCGRYCMEDEMDREDPGIDWAVCRAMGGRMAVYSWQPRTVRRSYLRLDMGSYLGSEANTELETMLRGRVEYNFEKPYQHEFV